VVTYDPTNSGAIAYREVAEQLDAIDVIDMTEASDG
jgi:hypothetical protein